VVEEDTAEEKGPVRVHMLAVLDPVRGRRRGRRRHGRRARQERDLCEDTFRQG